MAEILTEQYQLVFSQPYQTNNAPYYLFTDEPQSATTISLISFHNSKLKAAMRGDPSMLQLDHMNFWQFFWKDVMESSFSHLLTFGGSQALRKKLSLPHLPTFGGS